MIFLSIENMSCPCVFVSNTLFPDISGWFLSPLSLWVCNVMEKGSCYFVQKLLLSFPGWGFNRALMVWYTNRIYSEPINEITGGKLSFKSVEGYNTLTVSCESAHKKWTQLRLCVAKYTNRISLVVNTLPIYPRGSHYDLLTLLPRVQHCGFPWWSHCHHRRSLVNKYDVWSYCTVSSQRMLVMYNSH